MKKIIIAIIIIILLVAGYILIVNKPGTNKTFTNAYSHTSGAFTIKIPDGYKAMESDKVIVVSTATEDSKDVTNLGILHFPNYLNTYKQLGVDVVEETVGMNKVFVLSSKDFPQLGRQYLIPVEEGDNPSYFIAGGVVPNVVGFSEADFVALLGTIEIDEEKLAAFLPTIPALPPVEGTQATSTGTTN